MPEVVGSPQLTESTKRDSTIPAAGCSSTPSLQIPPACEPISTTPHGHLASKIKLFSRNGPQKADIPSFIPLCRGEKPMLECEAVRETFTGPWLAPPPRKPTASG